jgi:hypothetical protein
MSATADLTADQLESAYVWLDEARLAVEAGDTADAEQCIARAKRELGLR